MSCFCSGAIKWAMSMTAKTMAVFSLFAGFGIISGVHTGTIGKPWGLIVACLYIAALGIVQFGAPARFLAIFDDFPRFGQRDALHAMQTVDYLARKVVGPILVAVYVAITMYTAHEYGRARVVGQLIAMVLFGAGYWWLFGGSSAQTKKVKPANAQTKKNTEKKKKARTSAKVIVEGNICAGKTTLALKYEKASGGTAAVHQEKMPDALHSAFVNDPAVFAYPLQLVMAERRAALLSAQNNFDEQELTIIDRSLFGDWAFAIWNYVEGNISEIGFDVYKAFVGTPVEIAARLDLTTVCFLPTPSTTCLARLRKRTGVDQKTNLRYLRGVSIAHIVCLASIVQVKKIPVAILDPKRIGGARGMKFEEFHATYVGNWDADILRLKLAELAPTANTVYGDQIGAFGLKLTDEERKRFANVCAALAVPYFLDTALTDEGEFVVCEKECFNILIELLDKEYDTDVSDSSFSDDD